MDVFHHDLKAVKELCFCVLDLGNKILCKVFVDNAIRCGEESKDVLYEVALIVVELFVPINEICSKIDFFCCPKASF
jgi:hypothetical protein